MHIEAALTKENFWDKMKQQYPVSFKKFADWLDEYKKETEWEKIFNYGTPHYFHQGWHNPKFHDLPHAFQMGIWHTYAFQLDKYEWYVGQIYDFPNLQDAIEKYFEYYESWNNEKNNA